MKSESKIKNQEGFAALISVIIIFSILLVLAALIANSSFLTRFNVLDYENKKVSVALAEACATTAMVNLAKDPSGYPAYILSLSPAGKQETIETGKTCRICSVSAGPYTIVARAVYNKAYTNLTVVGILSPSNFNVTSWDESLTFPAGCVVP